MVELGTVGMGILVLLVLVFVFWLVKVRPWKRFTSEADSDDVKEDRQVLSIDKEAEKEEKDENYQAKKLKSILLRIYGRAEKLKDANIGKKQEYLGWIEKSLDVLSVENVEVDKEKHLLGQINTAINLFLKDMPLNDKKISNLIKEARHIQVNIYGDIEEEAKLLRKKEAILREEFEKTRNELAA
ncbi:MAG TPA: hypothetical protein VJI97_00665 [Candidatus Nanoarchaeia archaeon]|nr:hypothetical protein [Candidatus Nanoarchaeia archaeon]